jgi:hypothetical protein
VTEDRALELYLACRNLGQLNEGNEMGGVIVVRVEETKNVCCVFGLENL